MIVAQQFSVRIESISAEGEGVGTSPSGKRIFVPLTAAEDLVEVEVMESRPSFDRGKVLQLLEPGPDRVEPRCVHAARCGGCQLQQVSAEGQLRAKEEAFYRALSRLGGLSREDIADARGIVASPRPFRYRIRCRLRVDVRSLGYLGRRTHSLEPLKECHLLVPELEALALRIRDHLREEPMRHLAVVELCVGDDGAGAASLQPTDDAPSTWCRLAGELLRVDGLRGVVALAPLAAAPRGRLLPGSRRPAPALFGDPVVARDAPLAPGVRLLGRPDVFAQANAAANEALVSMAVGVLGIRKGDEVLELFCGAGNFTFALAAMGARVTAVEMEGASIDLARRAFATPSASALVGSAGGGIRFISGDAARVVEGFAQEGRRFDLVLLDPPRAGALGLMAPLGRLGPRRIAYVSCDPATLARDARALRSVGYEPTFACPADMFPQTHHVEGVVVFEQTRGSSPA